MCIYTFAFFQSKKYSTAKKFTFIYFVQEEKSKCPGSQEFQLKRFLGD